MLRGTAAGPARIAKVAVTGPVWSSSRIVPTACPSATVALTAGPSITVKVSSASTSPSPSTGTTIVPDAAPTGIVSVPAVAT